MIRGVSGGQRKRVTTGTLSIRFAAQTSSCPTALAKLSDALVVLHLLVLHL